MNRQKTIATLLWLAGSWIPAAAGCAKFDTATREVEPPSTDPSPPSVGEPGPESAIASSGSLDGGPSVDPSLIPAFGSTVTASTPPPPISGGTLLTLKDGVTAVAADPDRDAVYIVNTSAGTVTHSISLQTGDEPGRLVEDGEGRVHVALRSGGALVTLDPVQGTVLERRAVCPAPRGVAWDSSTDLVWVACATGELVSLRAAGGAATTTAVVERDLRDVLIDQGTISVTSFRSAEILRLSSTFSVVRRDSMPALGGTQPQVVWRAVQGPSHTVVAVHQEHSIGNIQTVAPGGYGANGPGAVNGQCTVMGSDGTISNTVSVDAVLPVDVAVSPDGTFAVVVGAGDSLASGLQSMFAFGLPSDSIQTLDAGLFELPGPGASAAVQGLKLPIGAQATAVAFDANGHVLIQTRQPAGLWVVPIPSGGFTGPWNVPSSPIVLSLMSREDTGHDVFHTSAGALIACASCHPEGGDDGHVWTLDDASRRTPSLRGTIAGTAPYHWPGDQPDFPTLTNNVYTSRMSGQQLTGEQIGALQHWVEAIPAPPAPSWLDPAAVARGQTLFQRSDTGCAACHSGAKFTNNSTVDVGTGGAFQVPPLVGVGWRTPLLHDGCAATIADRFGPCSTPLHGNVSSLTSQNVSDLGTYLESL